MGTAIESLIQHTENQIAWLKRDIKDKQSLIVTYSKQKVELENKLLEQEERLNSLYAMAAKPNSILQTSEN